MLYFVVTLSTVFLIVFLLLLFMWRNGISPVPTSNQVRSALFSHLPDLKEGTIIELGSGWGHLVFPLSRKYLNCKVIGYENSPVPFLYSTLLNHHSNLKIICADFFQKPLHGVDLIVCSLFPQGMQKLREKLEKELTAGAIVVSHTHPIPTWDPTEVIEVDDPAHSTIYIYKVPSKS
ncbi:MAG: class I SAM-dependent methyltransferase [Simkaniaceae bacterium]|nr:class I SAM-dependent methyltransferase [Simkaniaceae bacterium]